MAATSVKSPNRKEVPSSARRIKPAEIADEALDVLASTQVIDIHTHLYSPAFGRIGLWGIDELLTYHYLEAELFRSSDTTPEEYWKLSKIERADAIWKALFVENSPVSESTRGVIAVLSAFGLPTEASGLQEARRFFAAQSIETHIRKVLQIAGIRDRKSKRLNSSHGYISYAVFCLKKKKHGHHDPPRSAPREQVPRDVLRA